MTPEAASEWKAVYHHLSDAERPGRKTVLGQAEPRTLRLAVVYAVLDGTLTCDVAHLRAALAVWRYCEDSAAQIFGEALGDEVADTILASLIRAGAAGDVADRNIVAVRKARFRGPHRSSARSPAPAWQGKTGDNPNTRPSGEWIHVAGSKR